jgi:hypothetical protein
MTMLIDSGSDYGRREEPDPDDERERRWEPISFRLILSAAGSLTCVSAAGVTVVPLNILFFFLAIALCGYFVKEALRPRREHPGRRER